MESSNDEGETGGRKTMNVHGATCFLNHRKTIEEAKELLRLTDIFINLREKYRKLREPDISEAAFCYVCVAHIEELALNCH